MNTHSPPLVCRVVTKRTAYTQDTHVERRILGSDKMDPYSEHLHTSTKSINHNHPQKSFSASQFGFYKIVQVF